MVCVEEYNLKKLSEFLSMLAIFVQAFFAIYLFDC